MIDKFKAIKNSRYYSIFSVLIIILVSIVQYISIETGIKENSLSNLDYIYKFISILVILFFDGCLIFIIGKIRLAMNIAVLLTSVLAAANHYVFLLHGTPFTFSLLKNFFTAMDVIEGYDFSVTFEITHIVLMTIFMLFMVNVFMTEEKIKRKYAAPIVAVLMGMTLFCYTGENAVIKKGVGWSWEEAMRTTGYLPRLIKSIGSEFKSVEKPESYTDETVKSFINNYSFSYTENGSTPDIILILNETFYDLNQITDVNPSSDYMQGIKNLNNAVTGYAVCPSTGGGTNRSEYELLTSNSLYMSPGVTPFNSFSLKDASSVVDYVESIGYTTLAAHSEDGQNYNRNAGYKNLGFDKYFFAESFENTYKYGNRPYETDESLYNNLIGWYEDMGDSPRFMYLLTIQNHGDYRFNTSEQNTVKTGNDYGEYTQCVDELITCISLSDAAFVKLTEYFETIDRDVVVCMVGDHAPSFAKSITDEKYSGKEKTVRLRSMPYVIWSNNIELLQPETEEKIGMIYMVPYLFDTAGIRQSKFYDYMTNLKNSVPVLTTSSTYVAEDGKFYSHNKQTAYTEKIEEYFNICYANIKNKEFMKDFTR